MTLPKKGVRQIQVDGETYRWMIRRKPSYWQEVFATDLSFAVEHATSPGTTLLVLTNHARPDNIVGGEYSIISPSLVVSSIKRAIQQGWNPTKNGSTITLEIETQPEVTNAQPAKSC